ncbi:MAG: AarF/UbiB family protein, partial [Cellvibrionaceae bacterium]|nr:AarF/UbiB family protein [Cellvibrionaceae bacterium]
RIYGIPVTDIEQLHGQHTNMKLLAERGVEIFFTQVFEHNFFHADMHPGNIFVSRNTPSRPQYIAIDMAIVGSLDREDQYYLARNMLAIFRRDYRQVAELHVQCGWVPADTRITEFENAIRSVCEPIFEKPLAEISFGQVLINLFRTARRFDMEVQPQLVLLQKTLLNIEGLGRQLYPELDLWSTAHPYLEEWLKERFAPNTLWDQFKRHAPEWLEKFPEVPQLIYENLELQRHRGDVGAQVEAIQTQLAAQNQKRRRITLPLLGLGCLGLAALQPGLSLSYASMGLAVAGAALLLAR